MENTTKVCSRCRVVRPLQLFGKHKITKDGLRSECKVCRKSSSKSSYQKNRVKILTTKVKYRQNNLSKLKERDKTYREVNASKVSESKRICHSRRRAVDPLYKLKCDIRSLITKTFKRKKWSKNTKTHSILRCDFDIFQNYLEEQFLSKYNRLPLEGESLDMDHKTPVYLAKNEEELIKLNHYSNLQWLTPEDHIIKTKNTRAKKINRSLI